MKQGKKNRKQIANTKKTEENKTFEFACNSFLLTETNNKTKIARHWGILKVFRVEP